MLMLLNKTIKPLNILAKYFSKIYFSVGKKYNNNFNTAY